MLDIGELSRTYESSREIARYIHLSSKVDLLVNCVALLALVAVVYPWVDHTGFVVWAACVVCTLFYRYGIVLKLRKMSVRSRQHIGRYISLYWLGVLSFGLLFGSTGYVFFPEKSVFSQILHAVALWVTSAASLGYYAPSLRVSITYLSFLILPVTLRFFLNANGHELYIFIGIFGVVYLVLQSLYSIKMNRYFVKNLILQLDHKELAKEFAFEVKSRLAAEETIKESQSH